MLIEWLDHPHFKPRVNFQFFMKSVTIGRTLDELDYPPYDPIYLQAVRRWAQGRDYAASVGWTACDEKLLGIPRTYHSSDTETANAYRRLRFHRPDYLQKRDECVIDDSQRNSQTVITIQDNFWHDLLEEVTPDGIHGNSRAEIAKALKLPPRVAGCFWRYLRKQGWQQVRKRLADGTRLYVLVKQ